MTRAQETGKIISTQVANLPIENCSLIEEGAPIAPQPPVGHWHPEPHVCIDSYALYFVDRCRCRKYIVFNHSLIYSFIHSFIFVCIILILCIIPLKCSSFFKMELASKPDSESISIVPMPNKRRTRIHWSFVMQMLFVTLFAGELFTTKTSHEICATIKTIFFIHIQSSSNSTGSMATFFIEPCIDHLDQHSTIGSCDGKIAWRYGTYSC